MALSDDFYIEMQGVADKLIAEFGGQFNVRGPSAFDETTLERTKGAERVVNGVVTTQDVARAYKESSTATDWTASRYFLADHNALIVQDEEVQVDGIWYPANKFETIKPADILVVYMLALA